MCTQFKSVTIILPLSFTQHVNTGFPKLYNLYALSLNSVGNKTERYKLLYTRLIYVYYGHLERENLWLSQQKVCSTTK